MNYFIKRDLNEYGPYSLADLQKYVASGNILLTDLCRSEGLTEWVPVSQVIGNIPVPAAPQPAPTYGGPAAAGGYAPVAASQYPAPPNLHWAAVLAISIVTCGIFSMIWLIVEGLWVKKIKPNSKSFTYLMIVLVAWFLIIVLSGAQGVTTGTSGHPSRELQSIIALLELGHIVMYLVTVFAMRTDIEDHFNSAEPIGLSLSGVMTFFFAVFYFQYHFTKINELKQQQLMGYPR
jgi:hypothetical protein